MLFARGFVIGFAIAAPVGPIGVLCIRRSIADGRLAGLLTGLGAATADACYGAIAAFGLTAASDALGSVSIALRIGGGAFLIALGARTFIARPRDADGDRRSSLASAYLSTVALTLTNPTTILSFAAIFAGLGLVAEDTTTATAALMVLGVFLGSAAWWLLLSAAASALRARLDLGWVNRISGGVIAGFGVAAIASTL